LFKVEEKNVKSLEEAENEIIEKISAEEYYRIINDELPEKINRFVIPVKYEGS